VGSHRRRSAVRNTGGGSQMSAAVVFDAVTFSYPSAPSAALTADLSVPEGAFVLVAGPTAGGKSTLLRAINGLVPHFSGGSFAGRVLTAGRDTRTVPPRSFADLVAFVPQNPGASFVLDRVEDELAYAMENLAVPRPSMRRRVEEVLDLLGLGALRDRSVRTLSGGERQRVAIAAALGAGPKIVVLDEPTSQLDPQGAEDVLAALQRLVHDLGMTVVLAEHRLERVAGFAEHVIACRPGAPAAIGAPDEVLAALEVGPPVARLGRLLGWRPVPLTVRDARRFARAVVVDEPRRIPRTPGEVLLEARGVAAGYNGTRVLTGIDLALGSGEVVALLGRNGAGKTTLLRSLAGLHPVAEGTVTSGSGRPRPGIDAALLPQDPDLVLFKDSVLAEVAATAGRVPADRAMEWAGVIAIADRHPRDLSSGQRLLVAVAAIAATGAPVLLLDEPTRGVDVASKDHLARFITSYAAAGHAVMIATHDVEFAAGVAQRAVMIGGGELIADGHPSDVMGDSPVFAPQTARVFGPQWLTPGDVVP
jgi:energy-coupling factor transport system ATP-binding protein